MKVNALISALVMVAGLSACATVETPVTPAVSKVIPTVDLAEALAPLQTLPAEKTLVVFDIDDTLLTATEFFGSDKWYDWQRGRALDAQGQPQPIADGDKVACLFDTLGISFEIATNVPTQANMANLVHSIKNDIVILTARSGAYRAATMRELARNDLDFKSKHMLGDKQALVYDVTMDGRTAQVSYQQGVFMASGMNKGVMLLDLLSKVNQHYDNVIFVDDKLKNITNMQKALATAGVNFYGFHYQKVDKSVSDEEVAEAKAAEAGLLSLLNHHYPQRGANFAAGQCDY